VKDSFGNTRAWLGAHSFVPAGWRPSWVAILRAAASFAPSLGSDFEQQLLYLVVDLLLLLGLLSFDELSYQDVGRTGAFGFLMALFGVLVVSSSRVIPGLDLYPMGALALVGGLIVLCGCAWRVKALPVWVPTLALNTNDPGGR
jgi:hypothetical protein